MTEDSANVHREAAAGGDCHPRGRPGSWMLAGVVIAAFYTAGLAVIGHLWVLFWSCGGLVALAIPVGALIAFRGSSRHSAIGKPASAVARLR